MAPRSVSGYCRCRFGRVTGNYTTLAKPPLDSNGAPNEKGRRHESHEGQKHEGHEGKEGQRHCQGQVGQGTRLQWQKAEDPEWYDQGQFRQKQERQDCLQKSLRACQEVICKQRSQGVVRCCQGGPQGLEPHWLCCYWWQVSDRQSPLCQGEVFAQVKDTVPFKRSTLPPWVPRGEALCGWRMRRSTQYIVSCPSAQIKSSLSWSWPPFFMIPMFAVVA